MNKKAKITIGLLVFLNLVLMAFLFFGKPKHPKHKAPKDIIIEKLNFDKNQQEDFKLLIVDHSTKAKELQNQIANYKTQLYKEINYSTKYNDSISRLIGEKFEELEKLHYNHFIGIKNICREDQKESFKDLAEQLHTIFRPAKRKGRRKIKH